VLIGNSIGGAAAIGYAHAHPSHVAALVLRNPGGLAPVDQPSRLFITAMTRFFGARARGARWFPRAFAAYYRLVLPSPAARAQRERIIAAAPDTAAVIAEAWRSFADPAEDLGAMLAELDCPIQFAWARSDRIVALARS
jgi:4,5:9,10-diseco-3-hydroxy-5,9,17-trioxoandrosta-1(10),2-diene-4-oate hydrolase